MISSSANRILIVISDIEMGAGGDLDDFPHASEFTEFMAGLNRPPYASLEIDLVFNGDTFDFLKTSIDDYQYPHLINNQVALKKFDRIHEAHKTFFEDIKLFISKGVNSRRVHFVVGNHDSEILFPSIQERMVEACGGSGQIFFPGFHLKIGDVHIEHGHQQDPLFYMDPNEPFIHHNGEQVLKLPWASVTLLNAFLPYQRVFYELDRIRPKSEIFQALPELKEWLKSKLWNYWTNDYFKKTDPLKRVSWSMVKEIIKRSAIFNPDIQVSESYIEQLKKDEQLKLLVIGHVHDHLTQSFAAQKFVQNGCFRDEFMISQNSKDFIPIQKSYCMVFMKDGRLLESHNCEWNIYFNKPLPNIRPLEEYHTIISELLGPTSQRIKERKQIEQQEQLEVRPS